MNRETCSQPERRERFNCGIRGCEGWTTRRGVRRHCAQKAIVTCDGHHYCYYHHPGHPRKFGEPRYPRETSAAVWAWKAIRGIFGGRG